MFANIRLKEDPVKLFWKKANMWRKLFILRCLNAFETDVAKKYLKEMVKLQNVDGGFSKEQGETSSVSFTAEAIMNLTQSDEKPNSQILKKAAAFLWSIQRENGSWSENPKISKEKISILVKHRKRCSNFNSRRYRSPF